MNVVIASSSIDCGIGCWDLQTGAEQLRYKTCASPPHGLTSVGCRFLACSQLRDPSATSGHVFYWSWFKPQAEVKSFPAEPIKPLAANSEGSYIVGGGSSGDIYFWEVATGRLLRKWHAHYRAVTSLVFSEDNSLLISGSEDGCVRVWSLFIIFDDVRRQQASHLYEYSFTEHTLRVTDIVMGYGGSSAIIVSASEDRTCKVWSLFRGRLLRNIVFPSIIDAIALDPGEHVFYAGSRDGKIYIAALNAESSPSSSYGLHIIGSLSDHSKPVTCLAYSAEGNLLLSGSEDGLVRVWDVKTQNIIRMFRHAKGPVNNILIVRRPLPLGRAGSKEQASSRRHETSLPPPLEKYANSTDEDMDNKAIITLPATSDLPSYLSAQLINDHVKELQQQSSSAAAEMEVKRLKLDCKRSMQMVQQLKNVYDNLQEFCVNELLDGEQMEGSEGKSL
ncbi:protein ROOT INITIATION DEFECTIVE 3 isoform X1 [Durio zibethinus]|uniref:Protein ROOT INITIATION DEFECTIVE 3 isoform X1 n=1 Tax=Durio zibethinus TaxID=66656 RepID=A0A6P6AVC3_DURZI|nr:protein ROOT INITIATION DEFECTIVE 3 isoform X1 [Durio zibethinus]XP_022768747.1 protein ROOT INITIATION DEFECTIVE 3 isoform X1 [Durio zibethinus]